MDRSPISKAGLRKRLEDLEPVIDGICRVAGTPGISIAVSYQGEVIHRLSSGYSNLETSRPVTRSTQFPIGTMMKTFTAAAASILVNEGKLTWNTPIRAIIPELETQSQVVTENLTVVDLLSHRSGLGRSNLWWQGAESTLLLDKKDLVPFYNTLPSTGNFRGGWAYSNWGYALVGEVIERLSGKTFAEYLKEKIFDPLGLKNTTVNLVDPASTPDLARPYAALDDTSPYLLPQSPILGDTIMAPALGGVSTAEDLLTYSMALLRSFRHETGMQTSAEPLPIKHALKQLSGHVFTAESLLERSYAFGWYRNQLPNTVLGMGWNSLYVKQMPKITPKSHVGPLIAHGGSLPGSHVSIALLPELDSSVVICTNSIALGDVSGWVSMAILEAIIDTPHPSDYLALATEAAANAALNVKTLQDKLEISRAKDTSMRKVEEYIGEYRDAKRQWTIVVRASEISSSGLEVAFQGLDSQVWSLSHHEHDTFLWLSSREEQAKRGRMVTYPLSADHFKLIFQTGEWENGKINRILWTHEAGAPVDEGYFWKDL